MILMIDNYDSFTFNLVQYLGELGREICVRRNDQITIEEVRQLKPAAIVISPGPGHPSQIGMVLDVIHHFGDRIPILGVCLGHQAISQAFGGKVVQAHRIMHGKTSAVYHDGRTIFEDIPSPFQATRYHSLLVERDSLPKELLISAETDTGEVMGLRHRDYPIEGVQFHPESILTENGKKLLHNFLSTYAA